MKKSKTIVGILANESTRDHELWVNACEDFIEEIQYSVVNLISDNWLNRLTNEHFDYLLAKPPGLTAPFKQLYDERIYLLDNVLKFPIYPSPTEIFIYENKRFLYSWLAANKLPHPETHVFYNKEESIDYLNHSIFPIVGKVNIGASGSGVRVLRDKKSALDYIYQSFSPKGVPNRWGPNLEKGNLFKRGSYYLFHPSEIKEKLINYEVVRLDRQRNFVLFQKFIPHDYEWRIVAIGDSYFAHKKLKVGDKASGSLLKNYDNPPQNILDFSRNIMMKYGFFSQAIDVFETDEGELLINEMQCIFGQSDPYQMLINGKPGRYQYFNDIWQFQEGDFNKNESYNLRLEHILNKLVTR